MIQCGPLQPDSFWDSYQKIQLKCSLIFMRQSMALKLIA